MSKSAVFVLALSALLLTALVFEKTHKAALQDKAALSAELVAPAAPASVPVAPPPPTVFADTSAKLTDREQGAASTLLSRAQDAATVKAGALVIDKISMKRREKGFDLFFTVANTGKNADAITDAETAFEGVSELVTKTGDEEKESRINVLLPPGGTVALSPDTQWLRFITPRKIKEGEVFAFTLNFRGSPNAIFKLTAQ